MRDLDEPLPLGGVGAPDLSAALDRYGGSAAAASDLLTTRAIGEAEQLVRSAEEYLELDALLVPRSLR